MPKEMCGPGHCHNKRDAVKTEIGAKRNTKRNCLKTSKKNYGIAFHYHETVHVVDFESTQPIEEEKHTGKG